MEMAFKATSIVVATVTVVDVDVNDTVGLVAVVVARGPAACPTFFPGQAREKVERGREREVMRLGKTLARPFQPPAEVLFLAERPSHGLAFHPAPTLPPATGPADYKESPSSAAFACCCCCRSQSPPTPRLYGLAGLGLPAAEPYTLSICGPGAQVAHERPQLLLLLSSLPSVLLPLPLLSSS